MVYPQAQEEYYTFPRPKTVEIIHMELGSLGFYNLHHISPNQMDSQTKYEKSPINSPRQILRHDLSILLCPPHVFVDLNLPNHMFQS